MAEETATPKSQLRRAMGFWDVLLFNIAAVLGPRWIAAAAHNGTSSISLWFFAAVFFFLPTALIIIELSTRYPAEGGLYVWSKEAFGDFHGFVAGWSYWIYTFFYFPGLLTASVAMSVYIGGPKYAWLAGSPRYLLWASLLLLAIAVLFNIVGLDIGKWLQNAGGVSTYVPLVMLVGIGTYLAMHRGSATHFSWPRIWPEWPPDIDKLNFWSSIAFAFTGMELVCAMSEEIRDPRKTFPRAIYASTGLIAVIYILGTMALLWLLPADQIDPRNGVFSGISFGSAALGIAWFGMLAALLVTVGNAGGVGATVAGVARVPFVAGIDHYLPAFFGKIHPKWKTPYISILIQAVLIGCDSCDFPDQRHGDWRLSISGFDVSDFVLHSVLIYVCGGNQTGASRRPRRRRQSRAGPRRKAGHMDCRLARVLDYAGLHGPGGHSARRRK